MPNAPFASVSGSVYTPIDMNGFSGASGNVTSGALLTDMFTDPTSQDWHLNKINAPVEARQQGLDGVAQNWGFADDLDGVTRNSGSWSMGGYQFIAP